MSYQLTGLGAFSVDNQKAVCLTNGPSGAYWDDLANMCRGLTTGGQMSMCVASGGRWDPVGLVCQCPPSWTPWPSAGTTGCQTAYRTLARSTALRVSARAPIQASQPAPTNGGGAPGAGDQVVAVQESPFPWMWVIGGVAAIGIIGAGVYYATR